MNMEANLKVLILDNEKTCIDNLSRSLGAFDYVKVLGCFQDNVECIKYMKHSQAELIFLDIELGEGTGFEMAEYIEKHHPHMMIIFLTGYENYAMKGYEYHPIDFLSKPVNLSRLDKALSRACMYKYKDKQKKDTKIGIHVDGGYKIISIDDILYIEKINRKIFIVCKDGERYISKDSLQKLGVIFNEYNFYRSHQSFLIPVDKVKGIVLDSMKNTYQIQIYGLEEKIPLSRDKYQELKKMLVEKGVKFF